jgi:hypothetical protein
MWISSFFCVEVALLDGVAVMGGIVLVICIIRWVQYCSYVHDFFARSRGECKLVPCRHANTEGKIVSGVAGGGAQELLPDSADLHSGKMMKQTTSSFDTILLVPDINLLSIGSENVAGRSNAAEYSWGLIVMINFLCPACTISPCRPIGSGAIQGRNDACRILRSDCEVWRVR